MTSISTRLGEWAAGFGLDDAPAGTAAEAMRCIVDVTGVTLAGTFEPVSQMAARLVQEEMGAGECTLLGSSARTTAPGAAYANAVAAHALDFDDTCYDGILHGSAVVWPAVLAAAERMGASGAEALTGYVAGVEAEYAIGRAIGDRLYWSGWWTTALLGTIGAAVGAARTFKLSPKAAAHAVSLAVSQPIGLRAILGTTAKPHFCGLAAQAGLWAALAARAGIAGPDLVFEGDRGLARVLQVADAEMEVLREEIGRRFVLAERRVAFKLFPACSAAQAAMEATGELLSEHGLVEADVEKVVCEVTPLVEISLMHRMPRSSDEARFSMPFGVAAMLLAGGLEPDMMCDAILRDERWLRAMAKVEMEGSQDLVATAEQRRDHPEGAIVTIHTRDGRHLARHKGAATGMPSNPMPDERLAGKFRLCAGRVLPPADADLLRAKILRLDRLPSATDLFDTSAPFS